MDLDRDLVGARVVDREEGKVLFSVFALDKGGVTLLLKSGERGEVETIPMEEGEKHLYHALVEGRGLDLEYKFRLEGQGDFPDPCSQYQPGGVHGFSRVVDHGAYTWGDKAWKGIQQEELIFYEAHVGTFTREGTFQALAKSLDYLQGLGITALELMPVNQTPGRWNWGYDGTGLFSVNHNYGTPEDLKSLVDACHQRQIAVFLDMVYNHFGPEGSYLSQFGPYFTDKHKTPWGSAVNYDDHRAWYTRKMVLDSVRFWIGYYHVDGLRLDAVHTIQDRGPVHILQDISTTARQAAARQGKKAVIVAETDENDVKLIKPRAAGGHGLDAQWMDDFHHCLHTLLTPEREGYYMDYGRPEDLEKVFKNYIYTGQRSRFWDKGRGTDAFSHPGEQFVVALQTHDQVGNRARGERLSSLVEFPYLKAAAGLVFFSPYLPLMFMGEEYGERNPFLFFTDFHDPALKEAVSRGRKEEFQRFNWGEIPDPEDDQTFYRSRLTPREDWTQENTWLFNFYRDLIDLRKTHPVLQALEKHCLEIKVDPGTLLVEIKRWRGKRRLTGFFNLGQEDRELPPHGGSHLLNSQWEAYGGKVKGESPMLQRGSMILVEDQQPGEG